MSSVVPYPVLVTADRGQPLSRWLWLVKWLLLIPHNLALGFLWLAYVVLTVVALAAILVTGRYPRVIFEFNRGVLRWTWRVAFYGYSALGTDEYPPFTLAAVPWYPATLDVERPAALSRGRVLVQTWLLALPQLVLLSLFAGGFGSTLMLRSEGTLVDYAWVPGLIDILAVFAGVALLFTARYPRGIFDLVIGMNRWVMRVIAYASLMTDRYPPFRLDQGGTEEDPTGAREPMLDDGPPWPGAAVALVIAGSLVLALSGWWIVVITLTSVSLAGPTGALSAVLVLLSYAPQLLVILAVVVAVSGVLVGSGLAVAARRLPPEREAGPAA